MTAADDCQQRIGKNHSLSYYFSSMPIRDRIKEFRRVPAKTLIPHPKNWRVHNDRQRSILQGVLTEIGYADALLVRELPDGSLQLLDGHLRAETTPNQNVPVLILDLTDPEADKLLATLDPLAALADTDQTMLDDLLSQIETENAAVKELLHSLADPTEEKNAAEYDSETLPEVYQILITCGNEEEQSVLYERLAADGVLCRIVNL